MDKDFYPYLYTRNRVSEMIADYCRTHLKSDNPLKKMKIRKLLEYLDILKDHRFLIGDEGSEGFMIDLLRRISDTIEEHFKDLDFHMTVRIKDLFSTLNKLDIVEEYILKELKKEFIASVNHEQYPRQEKNASFRKKHFREPNSASQTELQEDFSTFLASYKFSKNPFNRIRDFVAFRIVIEDEGTGDKIDTLYEMANLIIELVNQETTFDVVPAMSLTKTGSLRNTSHLIFVPTESGLKPENVPLVKDYVLYPKADGYQSLHIVFYDPFTDQYVELQLCTRSMRLIAETDANHEKHKKRLYFAQQEAIDRTIDFSRIRLSNNHFRSYGYTDNSGKHRVYIHDTAGLTKPFTFNLDTVGLLKQFVKTW